MDTFHEPRASVQLHDRAKRLQPLTPTGPGSTAQSCNEELGLARPDPPDRGGSYAIA